MRGSLFAVVAFALSLGGGAAAAQPVPAGEPAPVVMAQGYTLASTVMDQPRRLNVWLPPSYAEGNARYPVLYVLDGGEGQDFHHISGLAQLATISGTMQDLIVVGVESRDRRNELTARTEDPRHVQAWPTHGQSDRFRRHLAEEVIPFVEGRFRTSGETAVMGESLAALFVVETFLRKPALFDRYIAISPSLWWDYQRLAKEAPALLAKHDAAPRTLWLSIADEGGTMQAGIDKLRAALTAGAPVGLKWSYRARPGENHATTYHPAALDALRELYGLPPYWDEKAPLPWWLSDEAPASAAPAK